MPTAVSDYRALISGFSWWGSGVVNKPTFITYSFETKYYENLNAPTFSNAFRQSFRPLTEAQKTVALAALKQWDDASGIRFLEVAPGQGDIRFGSYDLAKDPNGSAAAGYAYYPSVTLNADYGYISEVGGDVYLDDSVAGYDTSDMTHVIVHEIGHALGLKHPFEGDVVLKDELDNTDHTAMSYDGYGPKIGPIDIAAIRHLYGGPTADGKQVASWSWDAVTDTLTQIGGNGADTIRGTSTADIIRGAGGNDLLYGGRGRDRIEGGAGNDSLFGGAGDDTLDGGDGNDRVYGEDGNNIAGGGAGNDTVHGGKDRDQLDGGTGDDSVAGFDGNDTLFGAAGRDTLYGGNGDDRIEGGADDDALMGEAGNDVLSGDGGRDNLFGQAGNDTLIGGAGDDWLMGAEGTDTADYSATTQSLVVVMAGASEVVNGTSVYYNAKGAEIGYDRLVDIENVVGGRAGDDITGSVADNLLDGRGGADRLVGGAGNDTYLIDNAGDRVVEARGEGRDTLVATLSYALAGGQDVEILQFSAVKNTASLNLSGNEFNQTLIGNAGANRLDGGLGNDTLTGGKGSDTFVFSTALGGTNVDRITDFAVEDGVQLARGLFSALTPGELSRTSFKNLSLDKIDADDRILYRQATGELFYDADGSGKAASVKFAVLDNHAVLTSADFLVV